MDLEVKMKTYPPSVYFSAEAKEMGKESIPNYGQVASWMRDTKECNFQIPKILSSTFPIPKA